MVTSYLLFLDRCSLKSECMNHFVTEDRELLKPNEEKLDESWQSKQQAIQLLNFSNGLPVLSLRSSKAMQ